MRPSKAYKAIRLFNMCVLCEETPHSRFHHWLQARLSLAWQQPDDKAKQQEAEWWVIVQAEVWYKLPSNMTQHSTCNSSSVVPWFGVLHATHIRSRAHLSHLPALLTWLAPMSPVMCIVLVYKYLQKCNSFKSLPKKYCWLPAKFLLSIKFLFF